IRGHVRGPGVPPPTVQIAQSDHSVVGRPAKSARMIGRSGLHATDYRPAVCGDTKRKGTGLSQAREIRRIGRGMKSAERTNDHERESKLDRLHGNAPCGL